MTRCVRLPSVADGLSYRGVPLEFDTEARRVVCLTTDTASLADTMRALWAQLGRPKAGDVTADIICSPETRAMLQVAHGHIGRNVDRRRAKRDYRKAVERVKRRG